MPSIADQDTAGDSAAQPAERDPPHAEVNELLLVDRLQSRDHAELLGAIDRLRQEHIDKVQIPQIVVCGNQSSGKSSVLEAIAGVAFPTGSTTETRFATEVILRKSSEQRRRAKIIASSERDADMRQKIEEFQPSFDLSRFVDFGRVIEEAGKHMKQLEPTVGFWEDWLQIEVVGPSQPHLTLVDLPGIIQYDSQDRENAKKILKILNTYVENPRTTILAVIDAGNNYQNQGILDIIDATAARDRTLGVITKTDRLTETDATRNVIRLAKNEFVTLRLGWHVLRNLSHEDLDPPRTSARRDEEERQLFDGRHWSELPRCDVGIDSLRSKLSDQLLKSITMQLRGPNGLIAEMEQQLIRCREDLRILGPLRSTITEQRSHLSEVLMRLSRLIEDALDGDYDKDDFKDFFGSSQDRFLRDRVRLETEHFVSQMDIRGKQYHICLNPDEGTERIARDELKLLRDGEQPRFSAPSEDGQVEAYNVHLKRYCRALDRHMQATRGRNLPGMPLTITTRAIFRQLSLPWTGIAQTFAENCYNILDTFLRLAIKHVAGEHIGNALIRAYIYPNRSRLERRREALESKVDELLWPFKKSHPVTYNRNFNPTSPLESYPVNNRPQETWGEIARKRGFGSNLSVAADALDTAESYYNTALNTFIENVATLGVERCLLRDLVSFISPHEVINMDENTIQEIAGESPGAAEQRARAMAQEATLIDVIRICRSYASRDHEATQQGNEARGKDGSEDGESKLVRPEDEDIGEAKDGAGAKVQKLNKNRDPPQGRNTPTQPSTAKGPQVSSEQTPARSTPNGNISFSSSTTTPGASSGGGLFGSRPFSSNTSSGAGGSVFGNSTPTSFAGPAFTIFGLNTTPFATSGEATSGDSARQVSDGGLFGQASKIAGSGQPATSNVFASRPSEATSFSKTQHASDPGLFAWPPPTAESRQLSGSNTPAQQSSATLPSPPRPNNAASSPQPPAGGSLFGAASR